MPVHICQQMALFLGDNEPYTTLSAERLASQSALLTKPSLLVTPHSDTFDVLKR
jgi:hypothetical protein